MLKTWPLLSIAWLACSSLGCSEEAGGTSSTSAAPTQTAKPTAKPTATASATASAEPAPRSDCPKDSSGPGTLEKPCEGKGTARLMEAKWNNKIDDKGPFFNVVNKSGKVVLFTKVAAYFYDKAGKQLEVKDESGKASPYKACSSNIPGGVMKPDEKALIQFGCVKKADVPANTAAIEAEIVTVGFADATEKKSEYFWSNKDLAPDTRPKSK